MQVWAFTAHRGNAPVWKRFCSGRVDKAREPRGDLYCPCGVPAVQEFILPLAFAQPSY